MFSSAIKPTPCIIKTSNLAVGLLDSLTALLIKCQGQPCRLSCLDSSASGESGSSGFHWQPPIPSWQPAGALDLVSKCRRVDRVDAGYCWLPLLLLILNCTIGRVPFIPGRHVQVLLLFLWFPHPSVSDRPGAGLLASHFFFSQ